MVVGGFVLHFSDLGKESVSIAGGKGAQLGELTRAGIPVPPGFVVLTPAFDLFLKENNLSEAIASELGKVDENDPASIDGASKKIRALIAGGEISAGVEEKILSSFDHLGAEFVAVRSSATAEDASNASWAGELETYLNIRREGVVASVKKCWSSLFTPRAIFYRIEKKLGDSSVSVAVVVQKMVQSEVSGVAFTVHPVTKDYNQLVIEAGFGLGEAIVSGSITPDNYVIDKQEDLILDVTVSRQEKKIAKLPTGETHWTQVHENDAERQKLEGKTIMDLAALCKRIEAHYGKPQDIEWAFEGGKIFVTQSRPITTL